MNKFLELLANKVEPEKAFQQAFQYDYATMEKALKKYAEQQVFRSSVITFNKKLAFDTETTTAPLSEAEANAYLGDLLYHTREYSDAEVYLNKALALDANSALASTSLGLVKVRQRKFDEAKVLLEKAAAVDQKNYFVYYNYAYVLSRADMDEFGFVRSFPAETEKKMRTALLKAIELNPNFAESYRLLGFISVVNQESLDEAIGYLKKCLALEPGNQYSALLIAQIYLRQEKFNEAKSLAEKLAKTAIEPEMRSNAESLLKSITRYEEIKAENEKIAKEYGQSGSPTIFNNNPENNSGKQLTAEEIAKLNQNVEVNALNRTIGHSKSGETQFVGSIQKITCTNGQIIYNIKATNENLTLTSKDFTELKLITYIPERTDIDCDANLQSVLAVLTYLPNADAKKQSKGTLTSISFVPSYFRLKTDEEIAKDEEELISPQSEMTLVNSDLEKKRKEAILKFIGDSLRKLQDGETHEIGVLEKIECSEKAVFFFVKTATQSLKLKANSLKDVTLSSYTEEIKGMQFGCRANIPPINAVVTFRPNKDPKSKDNGEIIALEFVPKSFSLN